MLKTLIVLSATVIGLAIYCGGRAFLIGAPLGIGIAMLVLSGTEYECPHTLEANWGSDPAVVGVE